MLELKKIYHSYGGARVLDNLNLKIEENSLDAVIGPNGAGKSTLLNLIIGLEEPKGGKIEFLGERIDGLKPHKITKKGILKRKKYKKDNSEPIDFLNLYDKTPNIPPKKKPIIQLENAS